MLILCEHHGSQSGVEVSPDLAARVSSGEALGGYRELWFDYNGESVSRMLISLEFSDREAVPSGSSFPLPDEYPEWCRKLVPICEKCVPAE